MKLALAIPAALSLLAAGACGNIVRVGDTSAATGSSGSGGTTSTTSETGTGTGAGGGEIGDAGSGMPSDVTGTMIYRYFGEGPPVDQPADLAGAQVEAFVWSGSAWTTYPGTGTAGGAFTIPSVPAGLIMVDVAGVYLYTTAHELDLGAEVAGRPTGVPAAGTDTVAGMLQNLSPWQPDDELQWFDPNAPGTAYAYGSGIATGATSLTGQTAPWYGALIDGSQGDVLYAMQVSSQEAGNTGYATLTRFASFPGVEQKDGVPLTVAGALAAVAPSEAATLDFRATEFAKLGSAVGTGAQSAGGGSLELYTFPGASVASNIGYAGTLLTGYATPGFDLSLAAVPYGNPFPSSWGESVYAGASWSIDYTAPGATSAGSQYASVYVEMPAMAASAAPLVPGVTPPQDPQINGKSALTPLTGVGLTPLLSWAPPATGKPTAYQVSIYTLTSVGGATSITWAAEIVTTTTSLPLPPNVLQMGSAYLVVITAVVSAIDATTHPFHASSTLASADVLTGMVTP